MKGAGFLPCGVFVTERKKESKIYYMIGGYVTSADGIRDPQFSAEEGKQFTVNLTREFATGDVNLFARITDDHGQWVLPFSLNTGNNKGTFAQLGNSTRYREVQVNSDGNTEIFDFAKGRGWDGVVAGGSAGWRIIDGFGTCSRLQRTA